MMSSHSEQGEEKSRGFSLDDELKSLDVANLYNLVQNLIRKNPEVHRLVLEWFKEKAEASRVVEEVVTLNDELLMEYWEKAEYIISEFNEYGGGPEDEEEEAYHWLNEISELIRVGNISTDAKLGFLDDAFVEYDTANSGFDDALMDIFFRDVRYERRMGIFSRKTGKTSFGLAEKVDYAYPEELSLQ